MSAPMRSLCERPGCSEPAAVAYGMRVEDLVFWLDALADEDPRKGGVLCRRHADSMVVPRGWTLNDLRDPHLRLFRPPARPESPGSARRRRGDATDQTESGQLAFDTGANDVLATHEPSVETAAVAQPGSSDAAINVATDVVSDADPLEVETTATVTTVAPDGVGDHVNDDLVADHVVAEDDARWTPDFDAGDDLGGLLAARSPLLARAFRVNDRPV